MTRADFFLFLFRIHLLITKSWYVASISSNMLLMSHRILSSTLNSYSLLYTPPPLLSRRLPTLLRWLWSKRSTLPMGLMKSMFSSLFTFSYLLLTNIVGRRRSRGWKIILVKKSAHRRRVSCFPFPFFSLFNIIRHWSLNYIFGRQRRKNVSKSSVFYQP